MKLNLFVSVAVVVSCAFCQSSRAATWIAGADLVANEKPDGATDTVSVNATVPEWSYGTRATIAGTSLTLFTAAEHSDSFIDANEPMEGFYIRNAFSVPSVMVNTSASDYTMNFGAGPFGPSELFMHGGQLGEVAVVRYTVPSTGLYDGTASFRPVHGGDTGAHIVINGVSIFDEVIPGGGSTAPTLSGISLTAGDTVDFVVHIGDAFGSDSTAFDATITQVPEPAGFGLALLGGAAMLLRRRRRP